MKCIFVLSYLAANLRLREAFHWNAPYPGVPQRVSVWADEAHHGMHNILECHRRCMCGHPVPHHFLLECTISRSATVGVYMGSWFHRQCVYNQLETHHVSLEYTISGSATEGVYMFHCNAPYPGVPQKGHGESAGEV
eukprot:scaffold106640_cov24-Tisochrysis_lutea.AAC.1